jgi:hypothetical protein
MKEAIKSIQQQLEHTMEKAIQHPVDKILVDQHPKLQLELLAKGLIQNTFTTTEMKRVRQHEEQNVVDQLENNLTLNIKPSPDNVVKEEIITNSKIQKLETNDEKPVTKKLTGTEIPFNQIYRSAAFESVGPDNVATFHTKTREQRNLEATQIYPVTSFKTATFGKNISGEANLDPNQKTIKKVLNQTQKDSSKPTTMTRRDFNSELIGAAATSILGIAGIGAAGVSKKVADAIIDLPEIKQPERKRSVLSQFLERKSNKQPKVDSNPKTAREDYFQRLLLGKTKPDEKVPKN